QFLAASSVIRARVSQLQDQIDALEPRIAAGNLGPGSDLVARRDALITRQGALQQQLDSLQTNTTSGSTVTVLGRASVPTHAYTPNVRDDALIALGAGLLLGIALALAIEFLGTRGAPTRTASSVATNVGSQAALAQPGGTDVRMIGVLPAGNPSAPEVVSLSEPESENAQSYRSLQEAALFLGLERGRCLAVTSAPDRAGKTEAIANLAVVLARAHRRVIVVDCDLRQPRVHEFFGLPNDTCFTSVIEGAWLADALQPVRSVDHLYALTSGPLPDDPQKLLTSDRCREVVSSLLVGGTIVLIDTPPMLPVTDASALARTIRFDAIVLVATADADTREH